MSEYGSHSQLSTFVECGRRYQLERVEKVPRRPGFWFPGGTAVHATIEAYLREAVKCESNPGGAATAASQSRTTATGRSSTSTGTTDATPTPTATTASTRSLLDVDGFFQGALQAAYEEELAGTSFVSEDWFTAGRGKGEDLDWWILNGSALAWNFIRWYEANPDFTIWTAPDGRPAIELDLEVNFREVPWRGVIDAVFQVGNTLVVVDFKAGSTKPKGARQLGIYASALEKEYGIRPRYGSFFMCRGTGKDKDDLTFFQPVTELGAAQYSYEYLSGEFGRFSAARSQGLFLANPGENCRRCGVAYACAEAHGEEASRLDPNYPHFMSANPRKAA